MVSFAFAECGLEAIKAIADADTQEDSRPTSRGRDDPRFGSGRPRHRRSDARDRYGRHGAGDPSSAASAGGGFEDRDARERDGCRARGDQRAAPARASGDHRVALHEQADAHVDRRSHPRSSRFAMASSSREFRRFVRRRRRSRTSSSSKRRPSARSTTRYFSKPKPSPKRSTPKSKTRTYSTKRAAKKKSSRRRCRSTPRSRT